MEALPHHYTVTALGNSAQSQTTVNSTGGGDITTDMPAEFGGPGDQWSPESLLMAAVADCFVLTFRAIAQASRQEWSTISCKATGTLDSVERKPQFTHLQLEVELSVAGEFNEERVRRLLTKAEESCLVTNSLSAEVSLQATLQPV